MCNYLGFDIVQKARAIRDLQTDLAELVRQPRSGEAVQAARRVLAGDEGALAVLERVARPMPGLGVVDYIRTAKAVREGVEG